MASACSWALLKGSCAVSTAYAALTTKTSCRSSLSAWTCFPERPWISQLLSISMRCISRSKLSPLRSNLSVCSPNLPPPQFRYPTRRAEWAAHSPLAIGRAHGTGGGVCSEQGVGRGRVRRARQAPPDSNVIGSRSQRGRQRHNISEVHRFSSSPKIYTLFKIQTLGDVERLIDEARKYDERRS
jgi:hypothetical protein